MFFITFFYYATTTLKFEIAGPHLAAPMWKVSNDEESDRLSGKVRDRQRQGCAKAAGRGSGRDFNYRYNDNASK